MKLAQTSIYLGDNQWFDLYKSGLWVISHPVGECYENRFGTRVQKRKVLARGRMRDPETVSVLRGRLSTMKIRELLRAAGTDVKVVRGGKR